MKEEVFNYKCFTIEIKDRKIIIKDEFNDVIDILYEEKTKKQITKYIDENFKCE